MEVIHWITTHWLDLLQSVGIIGGLLFTAYTIRKDEKARRIGNYVAMADQHRSIWKELYSSPEIARVLDAGTDVSKRPVSEQERLFVNLLIVHLDGIHRATKEGMFVTVEGMRKDIAKFFSLPIPRTVWEKTKMLQDDDFVRFIESCWNGDSDVQSS